MTKLRTVFERLISTLPSRRKAQFIDIALSHIAEVSYFRLAERGFRPNGIIDIGAYHGDWSRLIARIYPKAPILMIEAQIEKKSHLEAVSVLMPHVNIELSLLGSKERSEVVFNVMGSGSSIYGERSNVPRTERKLTMHTLDNAVKKYPQLQAPLFIKLDVQGAEIDVLMGGSHTLNFAEVVQLEVALMNYNEGAPGIDSVINFMTERDFIFFDICGFVKPDPRYLSQIDVIFVRKDSSLREDSLIF